MIINGEIVKIFFPKEFGFNEISFVSFLLKRDDKKTILCSGESFEIFVSEMVVLEGEIEKGPKGDKFVFTKIKTDLTPENNGQKSFIKYVCGKSNYKKIYDFIKENIDRKFETSKNEENYIIDKMYDVIASRNSVFLKKIKGIGEKTAQAIFDKFEKNRILEKNAEKLGEFGLSLKDVLKVTKKVKDIEIIEKNPYKLMKLCNFSFNKCDLIFSKISSNPISLKRLTAAITYVLKEELALGNTYTPIDMVIQKSKKMLEALTFQGKKITIDVFAINEAVKSLFMAKRIFITNNNLVYLNYVYEMEEFLRNFTKKHIEKMDTNEFDSQIKEYEEAKKLKFGREQKMAIQNSMANQVSVITGGPGTGKTSSLACIINLILKKGYESHEIALCAPTGKAARRMSESINGQLSTDFIATTIHTLLQVEPEAFCENEDDDEAEIFVYNENNHLPHKVIVIDEVSMLDLKIAYSLISALRDDAQVVFVGDIEQLPPVGYGYFLRDAIESGIPTIKLLEVHRQKGDSSIIGISQNIRDERLNIYDCMPKKDYAFYEFTNRTYEEQISWIVNTFKRSIADVGLDQTMVLAPINGDSKNKKLGAQQISLAIQEELLPYKDGDIEFEKNGWTFRIGSKVIITKNNNRKQIVNGQIGYITEIDLVEKTITVQFEEEQSVILDTDDIENLRLAYAITVHKSQGSEWKNVIYVCANDTAMNKKPLVYTAITRAKAKLIICGSSATFLKCPWTKEARRRSRLLN